MACYSPLRAYRRVGALDRATGKWPLTFRKSEGWLESAIDVPCGKCEGCRMDQARQWAIRCMHEARLHDRNCVVTLTFDPEHVPSDGNLNKRFLQNWLKILRNRIGSFRYFGCGEYGNEHSRPHYHIILFGYDFPDKILITNHHGSRQYDSQQLRQIWPYGHVSVGEVNLQSASYIARYCLKKMKGDDNHSGLVPEFTVMSLKPGIGADFAAKYRSDMASICGVVINGVKLKIPKYYESRLNSDQLRKVKSEALKHQILESPLRTQQRFICAHAKLKNKERSFEND